jgi:hypothetical protein
MTPASDAHLGVVLASNATRRAALTPSELSWVNSVTDVELFWLPPHFDKPLETFE